MCCLQAPDETRTRAVQSTHELSRTYSSAWENSRIGTGYAQSKLNSPVAWCAGRNDGHQWMTIKIDLVPVQGVGILRGNYYDTYLEGVVTQGRGDYPQWVEAFKVQHSSDNINFVDVPGTYAHIGENGDRTHSYFPNPIRFAPDRANPSAARTQYLRLVPLTWHGHISMRADAIVNKPDAVAIEKGTSPIYVTRAADGFDRSVTKRWDAGSDSS